MPFLGHGGSVFVSNGLLGVYTLTPAATAVLQHSPYSWGGFAETSTPCFKRNIRQFLAHLQQSMVPRHIQFCK